jgi:hypothetical protein
MVNALARYFKGDFMLFPRLVYKSATEYKAVENAQDYAAALSDGWFASVPEALAKTHDTQVVVHEPETTITLPVFRSLKIGEELGVSADDSIEAISTQNDVIENEKHVKQSKSKPRGR